MMTAAEGSRVKAIKAKVLAGKFVSDADKQWVLDIVRREQVAVRKQVVENASKEGFETAGIRTI
jgi:hypothetical protein